MDDNLLASSKQQAASSKQQAASSKQQAASSKQQAARLNCLDVYKGICILFVIITHFGWSEIQRTQLLFPFWIDMAVPVFMVITGFVSAMSFQNKGLDLKASYSVKEILCKWIRFIIPFSIAYIVQILAQIVVLKEQISFLSLFKQYITGGVGPGSYYFPVMLQVVLVIPLIWYAIRKFDIYGLMICFVSNLVFEILKSLLNMSPGLYRLCVFRYIFVLGFGCFLYKNNVKKISWPYYLAGILGIVYIVVFNYTGANPLITNQWTTTSMFAVLFIIPIMGWLLKWNCHCFLLEQFGKASFNIFLVQMVYYWSIESVIDSIIQVPLLLVGINIVISCSVGYLFYRIEAPITRRLVRLIKKP